MNAGHGPLTIMAVHTQATVGITRIDVRCPHCGRHMHIERNGRLLPDVACQPDGGPRHDDISPPPAA